MILFEIRRCFYYKVKSYLVVIFLLFLFSILFRYIVITESIVNNHSINVWDYLIGVLSDQLSSLFLMPVLFTFLISDLILRDFNEGYLTFIFPRIKSRFTYFAIKCMLILIHSFMFLLVFTIALLLVGYFFGMSFDSNFKHPIFVNGFNTGINGKSIFLIQYSLLWLGLTTLGILALTVSILFNHAIYSVGTMVLFSVLSVGTWNRSHDLFIWTPLAQLMLYPHAPFYLVDETLMNFTIDFSIKYLYVLLILSYLIGWWKFRNMSLTNKKL